MEGEVLRQRILIFGGNGMLGQALQTVLRKEGLETIALTRQQCDIREEKAIRKHIAQHRPNLLLNCAAHTQVDLAESEEMESFQVNALGAQNIAKTAQDESIPLIHLSTDYVFDGRSATPYQEDDACNPLGVYGKSKRKGEVLVLQENPTATIVRTQWLYGPGGKNFVETMLDLAQQHTSLRIVADQFGTPTYTPHLARALHILSQKERSGIFHIRNEGFASWFAFAEEIFAKTGHAIALEAISSDEFPRPAPRPKDSRLGMKRWTEELRLPLLPHWKNGLTEYLAARP